MIDYSKYVGIPYEVNSRGGGTLDCWGLLIEIFEKEFEIQLPHYTEIKAGQSEPIFSTNLYKECNQIELSEIREGDIIVLNIEGQPRHVALAIDESNMIHTYNKIGSVVEPFRSRKWWSRIKSAHRHQRLV